MHTFSLATLSEEHIEHATPNLSKARDKSFFRSLNLVKTFKPIMIYLQAVFSALSSITGMLRALPKIPPIYKLGKWGQSKGGLSCCPKEPCRILSRRETDQILCSALSRMAVWRRDPEGNDLLELIRCWVMSSPVYRWEIWVFWRLNDLLKSIHAELGLKTH